MCNTGIYVFNPFLNILHFQSSTAGLMADGRRPRPRWFGIGTWWFYLRHVCVRVGYCPTRSPKEGASGRGCAQAPGFPPARCSYMIDNVVLLVNGTLQHKSLKEVLPKCHPLGRFAEMEAVSIAETPSDLFNAVLVETPLGRRPRVMTAVPAMRRRTSKPRGLPTSSVTLHRLLDVEGTRRRQPVLAHTSLPSRQSCLPGRLQLQRTRGSKPTPSPVSEGACPVTSSASSRWACVRALP